MKFRNYFLPLILVALTLFPKPAAATIKYHISLKNPEAHLFQVRMEIPPAPQGIVIAIPAWNALYQVRDFSYRLRDVEAVESTEPGAARIPVQSSTSRPGRSIIRGMARYRPERNHWSLATRSNGMIPDLSIRSSTRIMRL
jgi:hypothetical protein